MTVLKKQKHNISFWKLHIILVLLLFSACSQHPKDVLNSRQLKAILVDLHRTDGIIYVTNRRYGHSEEKAICYQNTLDKHGISQAYFDSSLVWYTAHPKKFEKVYDKVLAQIEKELSLAIVPTIDILQRSDIEQWASVRSLCIDTLPLTEKEWLRLLLDSCQMHNVRLPKDTLPFLLPYQQDTVETPLPTAPKRNRTIQFIQPYSHETSHGIIRPVSRRITSSSGDRK